MSLKGAFSPPGDKSISHRLALMSLPARGLCKVENFSPCADVASSINAANELGGKIKLDGGYVFLQGIDSGLHDRANIDCGNSGTTMRLLMGILAGHQGEYVLDGDASLRRRPMKRVAEPLGKMGAVIRLNEGTCPVRVSGQKLRGIEYKLPVASAQLKSALLLAGLHARGITKIIEPVKSRDHTERLLAMCGSRIEKLRDGWQVSESAINFPDFLRVPGDASSAAFFLCAGVCIPHSEVIAHGMLLNPTRIGFLKILERMGAEIEIEITEEDPELCGHVTARYTKGLHGCRIEPEEIPSLVDEVPILALAATQAEGITTFEGVSELRIKESDRLAAISDQLGQMGAKIRAEEDTLVVEGPTSLQSVSHMHSFGDHRIAMTLKLAALMTGRETPIEGEESISISYPGFNKDLRKLNQ